MTLKPRTRSTHPLKILFASSEALPYYKSGGLSDVSRSLPDALQRRGHEIRVIHPLYSFVRQRRLRFDAEEPLVIPWPGGDITLGTLLHHPRGRAPGVLLDHAAFNVGTTPYEDTDPTATGRRFALFSRAVLHYARRWGADLIHLNDWQTGLLPAYSLVDDVSIPTLFSIHNLAYQGIFPPTILYEVGLPPALYRTENGLEFYGNVSFLKGGLALSTRISTVSPSYAREIQTPDFGAGFDGLLRFRSHDLFGILNGIDQQLWDPRTDEALPANYDAASLATKDELRARLLNDHGMDVTRPLIVMISRLVHQKGIDILLGAVPALLELGVNLFVLGDGERAAEAQLQQLAQRFPQRIAAVCRFDDALARLLYAAGDFFLMPSRYEPCGLGQMIAQRYGTPPIVRATGGLRDTVVDGKTGYCFDNASVPDLVRAVRTAVSEWHVPEWQNLQRRCMQLDWSWRESAEKYERVYESARRTPGPD